MAREDVLIHVDNRQGRDNHDGIHQPVATADRAFTLLPPYWQGRAEIIFEPTGEAYPVSTSAMCFGTPMGPEASPLVIRGGYTDELGAITASGGTGDNVEVITSRSVGVDDLIGAVLTRQTRLSPAGSPVGTAISIRGNTEGTNPTISLQRSMGLITPGETFVVQRPAVTLVPNPPHPPDPPRPGQALNLTSDDGGSLNLTLIGIRIAPTRGKALNLLNVRAQCDTCEFSFQKDPNPDIDPITFFVHTNARIQGGIANADLSQELDPSRADAGVYIYSDNASNAVWAVREGVLAGHLTFARITVRVSQGGAFVPKSLEALEAPINILAGGAAVAEPQKEGRVVVGSWGTASNKARIRNIAGDGLRAFNGGSIN